MFGPHYRKDTQFGEGRGAPQMLQDEAVFRLAQAMGQRQRQIDAWLSGQINRAHDRAWRIERKMVCPSHPPSKASTACSGCGIRPKTLKVSLATPAMACNEPLGLASGAASP